MKAVFVVRVLYIWATNATLGALGNTWLACELTSATCSRLFKSSTTNLLGVAVFHSHCPPLRQRLFLVDATLQAQPCLHSAVLMEKILRWIERRHRWWTWSSRGWCFLPRRVHEALLLLSCLTCVVLLCWPILLMACIPHCSVSKSQSLK